MGFLFQCSGRERAATFFLDMLKTWAMGALLYPPLLVVGLGQRHMWFLYLNAGGMCPLTPKAHVQCLPLFFQT